MFKFYRIHLKTRDLESTAKWYMDHLGGKKVQEYERPTSTNILLDVDGTEILITQPSNAESLPQAPPGHHLGLEHFGLLTQDLAGLRARLESKGVEVIELPPPEAEDDYIFVRAPDGVRMELQQE